MLLKTKILKWSAGRPVVIIHKNTAEKNNIHIDDRVSIRRDGKSFIAVVDFATEILKEDEIIPSKEVFKNLHLGNRQKVKVELSEKPESVALIHKKMEHKILTKKEIKDIIGDVAKNALTETEIAYLISSIYNNKMSMRETADLTLAIVQTGQVLKFNGIVADKHCLPNNTPVLIRNSGEIKVKTIGETIDGLLEKNKEKVLTEGDAYFLEGNFNNLNVMTWDNNYKVYFTPVIGLYKVKSPKEIFKITLKGNREISLTSRHTIFLLKNGKIINIPSSEVRKGDFVLVPSGISEEQEIKEFNLVFENPSLKDRRINKNLVINNELMRFIGYFISEGFTNYQGIFLNFGSHEKELIEDAEYCIKKIFGIEPTKTIPHPTARRLCIYSKELSKSFNTIFSCGDNALNKKIPSFIFKLPIELKKEFIKALFKGDGYIRRGYEAIYVTSSKDLAIGLSYLLSSINASVSISFKEEDFRVFPQNKGIKTKVHKCYYIYTQAREILGGRQKDNVAFINLLPIKELGEIKKEKIGWEFRRVLKKQKYITKQKLFRINDNIVNEDIRKIINSDISVLEVKKTEKTKSNSEYVYDFKTNEGRFIAGFMPMCIHNSIGGIPGRTTPIVVSICACTGLKIPKTSSRAITTPAGTADAMETICKVDFDVPEMKKIVNKTNACLVWGGALGLAPADDKIIQIERVLNLDPESQLLASIMAKKISVGAKYVIIDIPYGKTAKVSLKQALRLKRKFEILGRHFNMKVKGVLSESLEPLGNGIGPALEIIDVIKVLRRDDKCYHLEKKSLELSAELLELTGKAKKGKGYELAKKILDSGEAFKKFKQIIQAQKGSLNRINKFKLSANIKAKKSGKIFSIDIKKINLIAKAAGCPTDKFSGLYLHKHLNNPVKKGEKTITIFSDSKERLNSAINQFNKTKPILIK